MPSVDAASFDPPGYQPAYVAPPPPVAPPTPLIFTREMFAFLGTVAGLPPVYPGTIPSGVDPAIAYTVVDSSPFLVLAGSSGNAWRRVQFDAYSEDMEKAEAAAETLRLALQDLSGPVGAMTVQLVTRKGGRTGYAPPSDASQDGTYSSSADYVFTYSEPRPRG